MKIIGINISKARIGIDITNAREATFYVAVSHHWSPTGNIYLLGGIAPQNTIGKCWITVIGVDSTTFYG